MIERTIAPSEDTRLRSASHETFVTGFEDKYFASPGGRKKDGSYGKRKHSESTGQARTKQFDLPTLTVPAICRRGMKPLQIRHDRRRHQQANLGSRLREHSGRVDKSQRLNLKQRQRSQYNPVGLCTYIIVLSVVMEAAMQFEKQLSKILNSSIERRIMQG